MVRNCLQTKLKSVVDNDTLQRLGTVTVLVPAGTSNNYILVKALADTESTVEAKYNNLNVNGVDTSSKVTPLGSSTTYIRKSSSDKEVFWITKAALVQFESSYTTPDFDISQLEYATHLTSVEVRGSKGSFAKLADLSLTKLTVVNHRDAALFSDMNSITTLQELRVNACTKSSGTLSDLGSLTSINKLIVRSAIDSSTVESFVAAQVRAGRTTATLAQFKCYYKVGDNFMCTFNGVGLEDDEGKTLSWAPNATAGRTDVTYNNTTITIDNTTGNKVS